MICLHPIIIGSYDAKKHMVSNLSTVAVVPITRDVPLDNFTKHLCAAVSSIGTLLYRVSNSGDSFT